MSTCTLCKRRKAIFMRFYSGENLCKICFCRSIESKVRTTISRYEMLNPCDKIMVAVSGGKDSVTLLHILAKIEKEFPKAKLSAINIDEGIKGYSVEAQRVTKKNCRKLNIECVLISFKEMYGYNLDDIVKMTREKALSPCSFCGMLRRKALNIAARESGGNKLATAHNLDDETQTMILNIFNGNVLQIARVKPVLEVIHPKFIQRIKPLCLVPEREIAFYAYLNGIEFQSMVCPYSETALRNDIRQLVNRMEEKHPGTKFTIFRSIEKIRPAIESITESLKIRDCKMCGEPTIGETCQPCQILLELSIL